MSVTARQPTDKSVRTGLCLFGAGGTNHNLGLDALMRGTLAGLSAQREGLDLTVFDGGLGARAGTFVDEAGRQHDFTYRGARYSRRVILPESYVAMHAALRARGWRNPGVRAVLDSAAVLDVSEGDSFSDIYGDKVFRTVCAPKSFALTAGRPLVLLPQTYGPFRSARNAERARRIVLEAGQAWARDPDSFEALRRLLGQDFDPARHREGVDLAFLLPAHVPADLPPDIQALIDTEPAPVGVNVSGLLWNMADRFALEANYRQTMTTIVGDLVTSGHRVLLVPHVLGDQPGSEADNVAAAELVATLSPSVASAVSSLARVDGASGAKGVISRCAFFVGTRMHSTIAALSSGVPCVALAYSPKYRGVFASAGVGEAALDMRSSSTGEIIEAVRTAVGDGPQWRERLARHVPDVRRRAHQQMRDVLTFVNEH